MIKKIIFSLIFICLLVAISIKVINPSITQVELGRPFLKFLSRCSIELQDFKIEIPSIPQLELFDSGEGWTLILNFFINVVNGLSGLINFIITIVNVLISVIQFLIIMLKNIIVLRDDLILTA